MNLADLTARARRIRLVLTDCDGCSPMAGYTTLSTARK